MHFSCGLPESNAPTAPSAPDSNAPATDTSSTTEASDELKMGVLLPATGDLSAIGAPMVSGIDLLVETVDECGGVLGKPINVVKEDYPHSAFCGCGSHD
jgi:neutral amino acid transport system substrate-binding protein